MLMMMMVVVVDVAIFFLLLRLEKMVFIVKLLLLRIVNSVSRIYIYKMEKLCELKREEDCFVLHMFSIFSLH